MDDEKLEREAAKILFSTPSQAAEEAAKSQPQGPEILFVCPFCNETYHVSTDLAGKTITCRNCREMCRVDSIELGDQPRVGLYFCFGMIVGIMLTALVVIALKVLRLI